jgi:hypothetical protein
MLASNLRKSICELSLYIHAVALAMQCDQQRYMLLLRGQQHAEAMQSAWLLRDRVHILEV